MKKTLANLFAIVFALAPISSTTIDLSYRTDRNNVIGALHSTPKSTTRIILDACELLDDGLLCLLPSLPTNIQQLYLQQNHLSSSLISLPYKQLLLLDLSLNDLSSLPPAALKQIPPTFIASSTNLQSNQIRSITKGLLERSIKNVSLDFSLNKLIGDVGCQTLAAFIKTAHCDQLTLDISFCGIGDEGAESIADSMLGNNGNVKISLAHNDITREGFRSICSATASSECCNLVEIDLSGNKLKSLDDCDLSGFGSLVCDCCGLKCLRGVGVSIVRRQSSATMSFNGNKLGNSKQVGKSSTKKKTMSLWKGVKSGIEKTIADTIEIGVGDAATIKVCEITNLAREIIEETETEQGLKGGPSTKIDLHLRDTHIDRDAACALACAITKCKNHLSVDVGESDNLSQAEIDALRTGGEGDEIVLRMAQDFLSSEKERMDEFSDDFTDIAI